MTYYLNLEGRMKVDLDWSLFDAKKFHLPPSYVYHLRHLLEQSETLFHWGKKVTFISYNWIIAWPLRSDQRQESDVIGLHISQFSCELDPHSGFPL